MSSDHVRKPGSGCVAENAALGVQKLANKTGRSLNGGIEYQSRCADKALMRAIAQTSAT